MKKTAYLFLNGDYATGKLQPGLEKGSNLVIGVDGGTSHLLSMEIIPQVVIGDLDSLPDNQIKQLEKKGVKIVRHPVQKDETDFELALSYAIRQGCKNILVFGATGGRFDHMLANIQLPVLYSTRASICLINGMDKLIYIADRASIKGNDGDRLSLIPIAGTVTNVKTSGLRYPLNGEDLFFGKTRGISNEMIASEASISISSGILLCIYTPGKPADERMESS